MFTRKSRAHLLIRNSNNFQRKEENNSATSKGKKQLVAFERAKSISTAATYPRRKEHKHAHHSLTLCELLFFPPTNPTGARRHKAFKAPYDAACLAIGIWDDRLAGKGIQTIPTPTPSATDYGPRSGAKSIAQLIDSLTQTT